MSVAGLLHTSQSGSAFNGLLEDGGSADDVVEAAGAEDEGGGGGGEQDAVGVDEVAFVLDEEGSVALPFFPCFLVICQSRCEAASASSRLVLEEAGGGVGE